MILTAMVTYNPEMDVLKENIDALINQVDRIIVFDNDSKNISDIEELLKNYSKLKIIKNNKNKGLPYNYNKAVKYAKNKGYDWLLIMDQDSKVCEDLIKEYGELFNQKDIGVIAPRFIDINTGEFDDNDGEITEKYTEIKECISSASLNNVSILCELGGFDNRLFIDYVDYEYCRRVKNAGYRIVRVNRAVIKHTVGESKQIKILGRPAVAYNHSPIRKYYYFRNRIYFARKHRINPFKEFRYYTSLIRHLLILFYEENTRIKLGYTLKGIFDGLTMGIE